MVRGCLSDNFHRIIHSFDHQVEMASCCFAFGLDLSTELAESIQHFGSKFVDRHDTSIVASSMVRGSCQPRDARTLTHLFEYAAARECLATPVRGCCVPGYPPMVWNLPWVMVDPTIRFSPSTKIRTVGQQSAFDNQQFQPSSNAVAISSHSASRLLRHSGFCARRYQYPAFPRSPSFRCR